MAAPLLSLAAIIMEFLSSFISFTIGYYALKSYVNFRSLGLLLLNWGFIILGVGTLLRVLSTVYVGIIRNMVEVPKGLVPLISLIALIYSLTQLVACILFVVIYIFQGINTEEKMSTAALAAFATSLFPIYKLFVIPWLEVAAATLLGFVAVNTFINWRLRKTTNSALVFSGF